MTSPRSFFKKQLNFFNPAQKSHGGSLNLKKRKTLRPLDTKMPLHVTLKSEKAKGVYALTNFNSQILKVIHNQTVRFKITIYEKNINHNHIHLLIRGKSRIGLQNFFRAIAGIIARTVTGANKGKAFGKFWSYLIFTRILNSWKIDFTNVRDHIIKNTKEVLGLIPYQRRNGRYKNSS